MADAGQEEISDDQANALVQAVAGLIKEGLSKEEVYERLKTAPEEASDGEENSDDEAPLEDAASEEETKQAIFELYDLVIQQATAELWTAGSVMTGTLGGLIAGILGGGLWAAIAIFGDLELGLLAWGIGAACGFGTVLGAAGRKGLPLQLSAVGTSAFGIMFGKYVTFAHYAAEAMSKETGEEVAGFANPVVIVLFFANIGEFLGAYDLLWFGLAFWTAWSMPKSLGIKPVQKFTMPMGR